MTTTTKRTPARTPQQIAQADVDKHAEKVEALTDRIARYKAKVVKAESELKVAEADLAYAKANPRLRDTAQAWVDDVLDEPGGDEA